MLESTNSEVEPRRNLIALRKSVNKTQREVAADLNISETYLRLLEKGKSAPGVDLLFRIAHYYGTDAYVCWPDLSGERPKTVIQTHN